MRISRTTAAVLGLMVATALGGCGGSTDEGPTEAGEEASAGSGDSPDGSEETPAEEPEEVVIERARFCDDIDDALVEQALGGPSQWLEERTPGQTFVVFDQKQKSDSFSCRWQTNKEADDYGPGDATFFVSIQGKAASPALVNAEIKDREDRLAAYGKEQGCTEADAELGDPSWSQVCAFKGDRYNDPNSSATAAGAVGEAFVTCYVQRNGEVDAASMREALDEICGQVPVALSTS